MGDIPLQLALIAA
jgi:hypothetical protein